MLYVKLEMVSCDEFTLNLLLNDVVNIERLSTVQRDQNIMVCQLMWRMIILVA